MDTDVIVIGAGVVGLACGAAMAGAGLDTILLEQTSTIGSITSSRNSEVIHSGLYYPTGSLKHQFCINGRQRLYCYLKSRNIRHMNCGKIVVATSPMELKKLEETYSRALANGVEDISLLDAHEAHKLEPEVRCEAAILSRTTGIMDSHGFMIALRGELEDFGGMIAFQCRVTRITPLAAGGFETETARGDKIRSRLVVNCAGLFAHEIAKSTDGLDETLVPPLFLAKGNYFTYNRKTPFKRLVYPTPVDGGLGIHATLDLAGRVRFGPDVEWINHAEPRKLNYRVDPSRKSGFSTSIKTYFPALDTDALVADYSGCRPKLTGPGTPTEDFRIDTSTIHRIPGLINLFGIESPGLTSALSIADHVTKIAKHGT
jgi:L-2-hydroxyglutarate oxidase LhgO